MSRAVALFLIGSLLPLGGCIRKGCEGAVDVECALGTVYPDEPIIDPDDPVFEDDEWTLEEVRDAFDAGRSADSKAYRAYRAARDHAELLNCPFCACGCASNEGHLSAVDCFKDMHGFT